MEIYYFTVFADQPDRAQPGVRGFDHPDRVSDVRVSAGGRRSVLVFLRGWMMHHGTKPLNLKGFTLRVVETLV